MFHFPMFHFPMVCMAPDTGAGGGAPEEPVHENAADGEAQNPQDPPADVSAGGQSATSAPPASQAPDTERAPQTEEKTEQPDAEKQLEAAQQRIMTAELRSAAALAGVPKERIPYVLRLADTTGIDLNANDAGEKIEAAIGKVLTDLPELRGSAGGTGSTGNFARKTGEAEDPDMARIKKNILG